MPKNGRYEYFLSELGGTMEERIREVLEFCVNNPDLDLKTFEQSKEYKVLNMGIPLSEHIGSMYSGLPIIIDGDLESIIISKKNEVNLIVLYALIGRERRYAKVICNSGAAVDFIRKELLPFTHIRLHAQYTKRLGEFIGRDISLFNEPLMYGHYICPCCGYDYGISKEYENRCCEFCVEDTPVELQYVTDYYGLNT